MQAKINELEKHLNTSSILESITEPAAIITLDGFIAKCNSGAKQKIAGCHEGLHVTDVMEECALFGNFDSVVSHVKRVTGIHPCRMRQKSNFQENVSYLSSLRSKLNRQPVAILLQLDMKLQTYAELQMQYQDELSEQAKLIRRFQSDGIHDPLTGLKNRRYMDEYIPSQIKLNVRHSSPCCIAILDIDHFKKVNDNYGHNAGDKVISSIAQELTLRTRESDALSRWGGEEFCLFLNNANAPDCQLLLNNLRKNIQSNFLDVDGKRISVTVSIGFTEIIENDSSQSCFERADHALYKAKEQGRNRVVSFLQSS